MFIGTLTETGVGSANYPVVQDYLRYKTSLYKYPQYDYLKRIDRLNKELKDGMGRNIEYYRELFPMAESISVIISDKPGNVNLKIALQYINAILKTGNN